MPKRISWKKGMRLTAEILKASDKCTDKLISCCMSLAASGRFGLIPTNRAFHISLNFNKNFVEIEELDCLAITRSGSLIDICFDTRYTKSQEARITFPAIEAKVLLLVVSESKDGRKETNDGFTEPVYNFHLLPDNSPIPADAIPVARIVNEVSGWQIDNVDFVPPCLFISSHGDYEVLHSTFVKLLAVAEKNILNSMNSSCRTALGILWPSVQQLKITADKEKDIMTPMVLLGNVQKFVSAFSCACMLEPLIELRNYEQYAYYVGIPYDYKNVYAQIKEGLELCQEINGKILSFNDIKVEEPAPQPAPAPQPKPEPKPEPKRRKGWEGREI